MYNHYDTDETIDKNFIRSKRGISLLHAFSRTLALNSIQDNSRLKNLLFII